MSSMRIRFNHRESKFSSINFSLFSSIYFALLSVTLLSLANMIMIYHRACQRYLTCLHSLDLSNSNSRLGAASSPRQHHMRACALQFWPILGRIVPTTELIRIRIRNASHRDRVQLNFICSTTQDHLPIAKTTCQKKIVAHANSGRASTFTRSKTEIALLNINF